MSILPIRGVFMGMVRLDFTALVQAKGHTGRLGGDA